MDTPGTPPRRLATTPPPRRLTTTGGGGGGDADEPSSVRNALADCQDWTKSPPRPREPRLAQPPGAASKENRHSVLAGSPEPERIDKEACFSKPTPPKKPPKLGKMLDSSDNCGTPLRSSDKLSPVQECEPTLPALEEVAYMPAWIFQENATSFSFPVQADTSPLCFTCVQRLPDGDIQKFQRVEDSVQRKCMHCEGESRVVWQRLRAGSFDLDAATRALPAQEVKNTFIQFESPVRKARKDLETPKTVPPNFAPLASLPAVPSFPPAPVLPSHLARENAVSGDAPPIPEKRSTVVRLAEFLMEAPPTQILCQQHPAAYAHQGAPCQQQPDAMHAAAWDALSGMSQPPFPPLDPAVFASAFNTAASMCMEMPQPTPFMAPGAEPTRPPVLSASQMNQSGQPQPPQQAPSFWATVMPPPEAPSMLCPSSCIASGMCWCGGNTRPPPPVLPQEATAGGMLGGVPEGWCDPKVAS
jgi:hypothetical protein